MPATCWLRSHTQGLLLIFHREEERGAYIILTEPEWRKTSLCYLHTHTHCQRFIVQGFNGALTHLSLSGYRSPFLHRHTNTHPSIIHFPLPQFSSSSPSLFSLSAVHLTSPFTSHFSPPFPLFFLLLLSPKTAPHFSSFAQLIESTVKIKMSKSGSVLDAVR